MIKVMGKTFSGKTSTNLLLYLRRQFMICGTDRAMANVSLGSWVWKWDKEIADRNTVFLVQGKYGISFVTKHPDFFIIQEQTHTNTYQHTVRFKLNPDLISALEHIGV